MITIYYRCKGCMTDVPERPVQVPARESMDVDILEWMERDVMPLVKADHVAISAECKHPMASLRFPYNEDRDFIGQEGK